MSSSDWGGGGQISATARFRTARPIVFLYPRKMKFNQDAAYGWNGGAFRASPQANGAQALAGNPGKRALNKDEPVFTPSKVLSHRSGSLKKISLSPRHVATDN